MAFSPPAVDEVQTDSASAFSPPSPTEVDTKVNAFVPPRAHEVADTPEVTANLAKSSVEEGDMAFSRGMSKLTSIVKPRYSLLPKPVSDTIAKYSLPGQAEMLLNKAGFTGAAKVAGGLKDTTQDLVDFFTSVDGAATLGIGGLPRAGQRAAAGAFAAYMAAQMPEQWKAIQNAWSRKDIKEVSHIASGAAVNAAGVIGGAAFAFKGEAPVTPQTKAEAIAPVAPLTAEALKQAEVTVPKEAPSVAETSPTVPEKEAFVPPEPTSVPPEPTPPAEVPSSGGGESTLTPEQQEKSRANNGPAEFAATQSGFTFREAPQSTGQEGLSETDKAAMAEIDHANGWEFTDKRPESPTEGLTVNVPVGSKYEDILKAIQDKSEAHIATKSEPAMAGPGSPAREEVPETGAGGEIYGIAKRLRDERAKAGQVAPVATGEGVTAEGAVQWGRDLLAAGADPEKVMTDFEDTKRFGFDDIAVARAHGEKLAADARLIEGRLGTKSTEYQEAFSALSEWDTRSKAMQTAWHKMGMAQQGETDLDTGSFTGLQRAYKEQTGQEFTPKQAEAAQGVAKKVAQASKSAETAQEKLFDELQKTDSRPKAESDVEARAAKAAAKIVREWAARQAEAERKAAVAEAAGRKGVADMYRKQSEQIQKRIDKVKRDAAVRDAAAERRALDDPGRHVWDKIKGYIAQGMDNFDDIRNKVATDVGMPVDQVTRLIAQKPRTKFLADDVWRQQQSARRVKEQAQRWLTGQSIPTYQKALSFIPRAMFGLKVGFHGTVALGTHAPMVAFQPKFWGSYFTDFGKMYRMIKNPAYYEGQVQDLIRRPNYITARKARLVNDPFTYEEYANVDFNDLVKRGVETVSPKAASAWSNLTGMGNRGYSVLKILRQDMFDQMWNQLPKTSQIPEVAEAIADGLNHATGVVKGKAPPGSNVAFFAPRLEASRVAWLAVDPAKAALTFADWKNASLGEKTFAVNQFKEKAWVAGTLFSMLALNQGFLSATGSKQKINFIDPMKSDFLKFKAAGMDISYGNAMISMARLPVRELALRAKGGSGKFAKLIYPDESMSSQAWDYVRTQLSPFASAVADVATKGDFQNRPLPKMPLSGPQLPMPKRLAAQGMKPYTWKELTIDTVLPIPAEEVVRDVWAKGFGMSPEQQKSYWEAFLKASVMAGTGSRITEDREAKKSSQPPVDTNAP
jgi:hypothetical protein